MRSAIICLTSKLDPCPWIVEDLRKKTGGDILRIIGSDVKQKDLSKYDRLFVMYQTELFPINEVFTEFCEEYKNDLKNSTLVISHPIREIKSVSERESIIEGISKFSKFWSNYSQKSSEKVLILSTKGGNKRLVERFSAPMGCEWKYILDMSYNPYAYSVILCPYLFIMEGEELNSTTAKLYIVMGLFLFFLGIGLVIGVSLMGASRVSRIGMISMIGIFLMYVGKRNLKNNRWRNKEASAEKSRELAIFMTAIPGLGHIYLGRTLRGLLCMSITAVVVFAFVYTFFVESSADFAITAIYAICFLGIEIFWLYVDIEDTCNKMGVHKGVYILTGSWAFNRYRVENTKRIITIVGGTIILIPSLLFSIYISDGRNISIAVFVASLFIIGYTAVKYYNNIDRKYCFDIPSGYHVSYPLPKIAVIYKGLFPSFAAKRTAARYSADLIKMFKNPPNKPLDLSSYDNILIEYSPNISKKSSRGDKKFLETNSQWVKDAGFIINIAYIYGHTADPYSGLSQFTEERISAYEEEFGKKYDVFFVPISDSPADYKALDVVSSELKFQSFLQPSSQRIDLKNALLVSFSNYGEGNETMSRFFSYFMLPFIVFLFVFLLSEQGILFRLFLAVMLTSIPYLMIYAVELLTKVPKRFLYCRMIKEDGTFGKIKHRNMWGIACIAMSVIMTILSGLIIVH